MSFINSTKSSSKVCTEIPVSFEASDSASGQWKVTLFVNNLFPFKVWKNLNLNRWISVSLLPYLNCLWLTIDLSIWSEQNVNNASYVHSTLCLHYFLFHSFLLKMFQKMLNKTWRRGVGTTNGGELGRCWVVMTTVTVLTVRSRACNEPSLISQLWRMPQQGGPSPSCHIYKESIKTLCMLSRHLNTVGRHKIGEPTERS